MSYLEIDRWSTRGGSFDQGHMGQCQNLIGGEWTTPPGESEPIICPMSGQNIGNVPMTGQTDLLRARDLLAACPPGGRHNPHKDVERYRMLGEVSRKAAHALADPKIAAYFARLIQRVMPKSIAQCMGEVTVTQQFLANYSGDQVRFLAEGFSVPGDHLGQESRGYRYPYGPVAIICPFNFPLEIAALQLMGALYMGNFPLIKGDSRVSVVIEEFVRLLIACGLPADDLILVHCTGEAMGAFLEGAKDVLRLVQFTGSSRVAELVSTIMGGRVMIEDAGFDWKIFGPDAHKDWLDYLASQSDQDAYAASGQKCSAQSAAFVHKNWAKLGLAQKMAELAERRTLSDLTIGPVLTWTNERIQAHLDAVLAVPGAKLVMGGNPLTGHTIPACYGAFEPTAVQVPLVAFEEHFELLTTELFGPFQIIVEYDDDDLETILKIIHRMSHHLTAAVVSADPVFQQKVLGATINGTTYFGMRARTTGAPQNHSFGPGGDPRGAALGPPHTIKSTWSFHREIIADQGPLPKGWTIPNPT